MADFRDEFLHRQNVANYRRQLKTTSDAVRREMLLRLLAEEQARAREEGWFPVLS